MPAQTSFASSSSGPPNGFAKRLLRNWTLGPVFCHRDLGWEYYTCYGHRHFSLVLMLQKATLIHMRMDVPIPTFTTLHNFAHVAS